MPAFNARSGIVWATAPACKDELHASLESAVNKLLSMARNIPRVLAVQKLQSQGVHHITLTGSNRKASNYLALAKFAAARILMRFMNRPRLRRCTKRRKNKIGEASASRFEQ